MNRIYWEIKYYVIGFIRGLLLLLHDKEKTVKQYLLFFTSISASLLFFTIISSFNNAIIFLISLGISYTGFDGNYWCLLITALFIAVSLSTDDKPFIILYSACCFNFLYCKKSILNPMNRIVIEGF